MFLFKRGLFSRILSTPIFRVIYGIKDALHKQKIHKDTNKNRAEDTDICINRIGNRIKHPHMKEEMSNRLTLLQVGAYSTATCFPSIIAFAPAHCLNCCHHPVHCYHKIY